MADDSIYFAEDFSPLLRKVRGRIVALRRRVCYQLDKERIPYCIYEDFYDMMERKHYAQAGYWQRLSFWIDSFDGYLKSKLQDAFDKKINFVRLYGHYIATMSDIFIITSRNILAVLRELKPSKVFLVAQTPAKQPFNWSLWSLDEDLTRTVLETICKQKQIPYEFIAVDSERSPNFNRFEIKRFFCRIFKLLRRIIEGVYFKIIYILKFPKRRKLLKEGRGKKIFILREGWTGSLDKDVIGEGHQILYDKYAKGDIFSKRRILKAINNFHCDDKIKQLWRQISQECIKEFNPSKWICDEAGVDISEVLMPRFLYFLERVCPMISVSAKQYREYFEANKVDYVLCTFKVYPFDYGAMAAATLSKDTLSVHIEHGAAELYMHYQQFSELPADIHITSSKNEALFYDREFNQVHNFGVKVVAARGWIDKYKKEADKLSPKFAVSLYPKETSKKLKVCYVPGAIGFQRFGVAYPLRWYYRFQKALCEHFAKLTPHQFVVKVPYPGWRFADAVLKFLEDLNASNVSYRDDDLIANFRNADRVIVDYPSTPSYEARLLGLPILTLYHESVCVRQFYKDTYGKSFVSFRQAEDAIKHVDEFLSSHPQGYRLSIEDNFSAPNILDILKQ